MASISPARFTGIKRTSLAQRGKVLFWVAVIISWLIIPQAKAQFIPRGNAVKASNNCYRITPDEPTRFGTIWWKDKIDLSQPFELSFIIFLGSRDGADGIAFVFHDDHRDLEARGETGAGLGFGMDEVQRPQKLAIQPSVAIEFDTYFNGFENGDIEDDHTTVVYNGQISRPQFPAVRIDPNNPDVENNQCHTYKITWNPSSKELKFFFDGKPVFTHQDDLVQKVFNGNTSVYYGFTGSTGGQQNEQTVCIIDQGSMPVAVNDVAHAIPLRPTPINVLLNDSHTRQEPIKVSKVVQGPPNGSASVIGNEIVYTARRGFTGPDTFTYEICESVSDQCYTKCTTASVVVQVNCPPFPSPVLTAEGPTAICAGDKVRLKTAAGENFLYHWKKNGQALASPGPSPFLDVSEAGRYMVEVSNTCGEVLGTNEITVSIKPLPAAPNVTHAGRCGSGRAFLKASHATATQFNWYSHLDATTPLVAEGSGDFGTPPLSATTTFFVAAVNNGCESERVPVIATVFPLPEVSAGSNVEINLGESTPLEASGGDSYLWEPATGLTNATIPNPIAQPLETTTYTVTATGTEGCQNQASVTVRVTKFLVIPSAFSPNGDGVNDTWEIKNILSYPNAPLLIFDRWGSKVFETKGYQNNWDGSRNGSPLPVGTYFYSISLGSGTPLTGSVSIVR